jgi:hypothetical protein
MVADENVTLSPSRKRSVFTISAVVFGVIALGVLLKVCATREAAVSKAPAPAPTPAPTPASDTAPTPTRAKMSLSGKAKVKAKAKKQKRNQRQANKAKKGKKFKKQRMAKGKRARNKKRHAFPSRAKSQAGEMVTQGATGSRMMRVDIEYPEEAKPREIPAPWTTPIIPNLVWDHEKEEYPEAPH